MAFPKIRAGRVNIDNNEDQLILRLSEHFTDQIKLRIENSKDCCLILRKTSNEYIDSVNLDDR